MSPHPRSLELSGSHRSLGRTLEPGSWGGSRAKRRKLGHGESRACWDLMVVGQLRQGECELPVPQLPHFHFRCTAFLAVLGDGAGLLPLVLGGALSVQGIWVEGWEELALSWRESWGPV